MTDRPTCETCRFRGRYAAMPACRRNPPGSGGGGVGWPRVSLDDWCGRHKPKPDPITDALYGDGAKDPEGLQGLSGGIAKGPHSFWHLGGVLSGATAATAAATAADRARGAAPSGALARARGLALLAEAAARLVGEESVLELGRHADYPAIDQVAETALMTAAAKKIKFRHVQPGAEASE